MENIKKYLNIHQGLKYLSLIRICSREDEANKEQTAIAPARWINELDGKAKQLEHFYRRETGNQILVSKSKIETTISFRLN